MPIPFVLLHDAQLKTEQFSPGMMANYPFFDSSYLKLSKQEYHYSARCGNHFKVKKIASELY